MRSELTEAKRIDIQAMRSKNDGRNRKKEYRI